jgi:hypothetical protein
VRGERPECNGYISKTCVLGIVLGIVLGLGLGLGLGLLLRFPVLGLLRGVSVSSF